MGGAFQIHSLRKSKDVVWMNLERRKLLLSCLKPLINASPAEHLMPTTHCGCWREYIGDPVSTPSRHCPDILISERGSIFAKAWKENIRCFIENNNPQTANKSNVSDGLCVFLSKFVDKHNRIGIVYEKSSRLLPQNYGDNQAASVAKKIPTVQWPTERIFLFACRVYRIS